MNVKIKFVLDSQTDNERTNAVLRLLRNALQQQKKERRANNVKS